MYLNMFLTGCSVGSGIMALRNEPKSEKRLNWMGASLTFWGLQFLESFTSTTYDCLDHVRHADCAIEELNELKTKAPRVDMAITNFHWLDHVYPDGSKAFT